MKTKLLGLSSFCLTHCVPRLQLSQRVSALHDAREVARHAGLQSKEASAQAKKTTAQQAIDAEKQKLLREQARGAEASQCEDALADLASPDVKISMKWLNMTQGREQPVA